MKKIGIIDIGSNSVRLVVFKIIDAQNYEVINKLKEYLRLGKDTDENFNIPPAKIDNTVNTLKKYKKICDDMEVDEIIAVATEAVRKSPNNHVFIDRVYTETGINIRIITGDEEAYYDFLGIRNSVEESSGLILDIGGCSTELIYMKERQLVEKLSIPYGALNITEKFSLSYIVDEGQKNTLELFLNELYDSISWLKSHNYSRIIGIGGSFRALGNIHRNSYKMKKFALHNYKINKTDIAIIYSQLLRKDLDERKSVKGLPKNRADIFIASAAEISTLMKYCNIDEVVVSTHGLREGLLAEYIEQNIL